jgi:hypothetical protein
MLIPTVFLLLQNISFEANSTASLACDGGVTWVYYPHMPIYEDIIYTNRTKLNSYAYDDRYVIKPDELSLTLHIKNVHKIDRGHYVCIDDRDDIVGIYNVSIVEHDKIMTDEDLYDYKRTHNKIHIPNRLDVHSHIEVNEGGTVVLRCESPITKGHKMDYVYVRHYKDILPMNNIKDLVLYTEYLNDFYYADHTKVSMRQTESNYEITLKNVNVCDSGVYECSIINSDSSSDIYTVTVLPQSEKPSWIRKSQIEVEKVRRSRVRYQTYFQQFLRSNI